MNQNSYPPNSDSSGFTSGFLLGLIIGGAGGYLLQTPKGKELLANFKDNAGDKLAQVVDSPIIADKLADLEVAMQEARKTLTSSTNSKPTQTVRKKRTFLHRGTPLK